MPDGDETPPVPKREESREEIVSSLGSLHDEEQQLDLREPLGQSQASEGGQVQKRKGGRKPLYQTTEEKKQRNRRAQAAFRERRTEHIKQLETDKKHLEERVESMEAGQRKDKDENLMLRYKNSLLERVLVEHNIEFRSEIQKKGLSYSPSQVPKTVAQVPVRRSVVRRSRPKPPTVDTRTPDLRRAESTTTASVTSASPIVPPAAAFTFQSPIQMPLSAGHQLTGAQTSYMGHVHPGNPIQTLPNTPVAQRRQSMHSWQPRFESGLPQVQPPYSVESETFAVQDESPLLQTQFATPAAGQQFALMGENRYSIGAGHLRTPMETDTSNTPMIPQSGQLPGGLDQSYGIMGPADLSGYGSVNDPDPFGIDRSMRYPTQFDFASGQRKQQ